MDLLLIAARVASSTTVAGRLEDAKQKYVGRVEGLDEIVKQLTDRDPSGNNKYLDWALSQIAAEEEFGESDMELLCASIEQFDRLQKSLPKKDIGQYDLRSLNKALKDVKPSKRELREQAKVGGSKRVWSGGGWDVIRVLSHDAMRLYGAGTMWCTTSPDPTSWEEHSKDSRIYVVTGRRSWGGKAAHVKYCVVMRDDGSVEVWNDSDDQTTLDDLADGIGEGSGEAIKAMEDDT